MKGKSLHVDTEIAFALNWALMHHQPKTKQELRDADLLQREVIEPWVETTDLGDGRFQHRAKEKIEARDVAISESALRYLRKAFDAALEGGKFGHGFASKAIRADEVMESAKEVELEVKR